MKKILLLGILLSSLGFSMENNWNDESETIRRLKPALEKIDLDDSQFWENFKKELDQDLERISQECRQKLKEISGDLLKDIPSLKLTFTAYEKFIVEETQQLTDTESLTLEAHLYGILSPTNGF